MGWLDWRRLFLLLGAATAAVSLLILLLVLEPPKRDVLANPKPLNIRAIYADPSFWRVAPLSALCIGSAWALQGLWAAPWLADVAALERSEIVHHLFVMAVALCVGALLIGVVADTLRRHGVSLPLPPRSLPRNWLSSCDCPYRASRSGLWWQAWVRVRC